MFEVSNSLKFKKSVFRLCKSFFDWLSTFNIPTLLTTIFGWLLKKYTSVRRYKGDWCVGCGWWIDCRGDEIGDCIKCLKKGWNGRKGRGNTITCIFGTISLSRKQTISVWYYSKTSHETRLKFCSVLIMFKQILSFHLNLTYMWSW